MAAAGPSGRGKEGRHGIGGFMPRRRSCARNMAALVRAGGLAGAALRSAAELDGTGCRRRRDAWVRPVALTISFDTSTYMRQRYVTGDAGRCAPVCAEVQERMYGGGTRGGRRGRKQARWCVTSPCATLDGHRPCQCPARTRTWVS